LFSGIDFFTKLVLTFLGISACAIIFPSFEKILEEKEPINLNYTYVIFGKNNVYKDKFANILNEVNKAFRKIRQISNQI